MNLDIQKASMLKRISAGILDFILLMVLTTGLAVLVGLICDYDGHYDNYNNIINSHIATIEEQLGIDYDISQEEFNKLTEEEQAVYREADEKLNTFLVEDSAFQKEAQLLLSLTLLILTFSLLFAVLILEFVIPLIFKNGQTIGKKIFGIGVIHTNGIKINAITMFIRTILGKYVIEYMIPVLLIIMIFFGLVGIWGTLGIAAILIINVVMLIATKTNSLIHDALAKTVTVDLSVQVIFENEQERLEKVQLAKYGEEGAEYIPGSFSFGKTVDGKTIEHADDVANNAFFGRSDFIEKTENQKDIDNAQNDEDGGVVDDTAQENCQDDKKDIVEDVSVKQ